MVYSILTEARIRGSVGDQQPQERGYSTFWTDDGDLKGWTTFPNLDIVGAWNGFLFGTKSTDSNGRIGPTLDFSPVDTIDNDRIFFRMKYDKHPTNTNPTTQGKIQWTTTNTAGLFATADADNRAVNFEVIADGKWHFYEINVGQESKWVGLVNNIRFFPCENGARNDEFFLSFFEIGSNNFTFSFDNPKSGLPGSVSGANALTGAITITKDVNDKLLVNIDDYGFVQITLTPQTAVPDLIARDISLQLGKVDIGGYVRSEAFIDSDTNVLKIESGTRDGDSSVAVQFGTNSAGETLGLFNVDGNFIGTTTIGSAPDPDYIPLSSYRPNTLEILSLFDNDASLPAFTLNPQEYILQGGRVDFGLTGRDLQTEVVIEGGSTGFAGQTIATVGSFDGLNKTLIDLNHPFSDDGVVDKIFVNGILDTGGAAKWKIFRPKLDGTLTLIADGSIGATPTLGAGQVVTVAPGVFVADVLGRNIKVRRGDLLGIFNARLHVGQTGAREVDALYYEITGEVTGAITPPAPSGAGEAGLPLYARGKDRKIRAAVDIDFGKRVNIDEIVVKGEEDTTDLEYNVAIANSTVFGSDTPDSHNVCYVFNLITGDRVCATRNNEGFNHEALNDNIILAENGIAGFGNPASVGADPLESGGDDVVGATYFYVNGDGEFLGTQELVGRSPQAYDFFRDSVGINCILSQTTPLLDKPIGKAVIYFKDRKNQRSWQIEVASSNGQGGSRGGFALIDPDTISKVRIDDKDIIRVPGFVTQKTDSDLSQILLNNPVTLDTIAGGIINPKQGIDFTDAVDELGGVDNLRQQVTFIDFQWSRFEWNFTPVRTSTFRWFCNFHWSTKISEFQVFATSESNESLGDNVQVLFSPDGEVFASAELIEATSNEAKYKLGNSPQFLRMIFRPVLTLSINDTVVEYEQDHICLGTEGRLLGSLDVNDAQVGTSGIATSLPVTNNTGQRADLIVDIPPDIGSTKQLLYFSKLNSADDIKKPQVGPPGRIDFDEDKVLEEEENVAINATAYGLLNLVAETELFESGELLTNGGFETGDLSDWVLDITQSGSLPFQKPTVTGLDDSTASFFPTGDFVFGFTIDSDVPEHGSQFTPVEFTLEQTVDITEFADSVDFGSAKMNMEFHYLYFGTGPSPLVRLLQAPTASGVELTPGTSIPGFGTNLLRAVTLTKGSDVTSEATSDIDYEGSFIVASGTRFVKIQFDIDNTGEIISGATSRQKCLLDDISLILSLPATSTKKWYKSFRTGIGDFAESRVKHITDFITTIGSSHWYQPFDNSATAGTPVVGQSLGFSNAFLADRTKGIQSFRRMTQTDFGILGCQWEGERKLVGFRIAFCHNPSIIAGSFGATNYPRKWRIQVLRTKDELGVDPDINNVGHFNEVKIHTATGPWLGPRDSLTGDADNLAAPFSRILTFVLDEPVMTEGIKLLFITNCDKFERDAFPVGPAGFIPFNAATGCPENDLTAAINFLSSLGLAVSFFVPLEVDGNSLPIDNVIEADPPQTNEAADPEGNIFIAVDLGRKHAIETDEDLLELVAENANQNEFEADVVAYGDENTDDPNLVTWAASAASARWVRFRVGGTQQFEEAVDNSIGSSTTAVAVVSIPQATLVQPRIYPDITKTLFITEGYNSSWDNLGDILSDNRNDTSIFYSDYPVIAFDLRRTYLINNDTADPRNNHDFIAGVPNSLIGDKQYWEPTTEANFAYASENPGSPFDSPEKIPFLSYGSAVPTNNVRWVAFKGAFPLKRDGVGIKQYNTRTQGQKLFGASFAPRTPQPFTENSNWFTTRKAVLSDISTFKFTLGIPFSVQDDVDFGASGDNLGSPYNAFDGRFDELEGDIWGVAVRDPQTNLTDSNNIFPHDIWRVFRDPYRGEIQTKTVKAITIIGYNESFYPTDFKFQKLISTVADPTLDASWEDIADASFTGIDSFQGGLGFTHVFPVDISTAGIRIFISDSVYVDDSVVTQEDTDSGFDNFSTTQNISGPQTRLSSIKIYEEEISEVTIQGTIETNHMLFSTVSSTTTVSGHPIGFVKDGNISTFWQSTDLQDIINITLPNSTEISRLEWEQDPQFGFQTGGLSAGAPSSFKLKSVVGGEEVTLIDQSDYIGTSFSGTLISPVTSDTFSFEISAVQGQNEDATSIILSELRLIEISDQTVPLVTILDSSSLRPGGENTVSTKFTYAANSRAVATVSLDGIDAGNDANWSQRDFFSFWLNINDVSLLDTNFGTIKLGNDNRTFYAWNISDLTLQTGWNEIRLQFRTAPEQSEIEFQPGPQFDPNTGDSNVDFVTEDFTVTTSVDGTFSQRIVEAPGVRFFELEFRGNGGSQDLELILDDFQFIRNEFDDVCKFAPSLYLNNSEVFTLNLNGLDLTTGTVEFWIGPDWDTAGRLRKDTSVIPGIFRILRPDGRFLGLFYRPNQGFVTMVFDGEKLLQFVSNVGDYRFSRFDVFHFALVWDTRRTIDGASLAMFIDGRPVYGSDKTWIGGRESGNTILIGGRFGQQLAATPHNSTALTFTPVPTLSSKTTASSWAVLENLKIYNYPKTDFSDRNISDIDRTQLITPSELLEISLDNVDFHGVGSSSLPLIQRGVEPDETATVHVRTNIPRNLTGQEDRAASLLIRWKTPLQECN